MSLTSCCSIVALTSGLGVAVRANGWPAIRPLHEVHTFRTPVNSNADTPFLAFIRSTKGVPVYKVECHNGNYDNESEIDFSGDFQCALFALWKGSEIASWNLLAANTKNELSSDWWNRGRMHSAQLRGVCLAYPEYSTDRHFKLRGMLVTLRFSDTKWSTGKDSHVNPILVGFTFGLDVVPDRAAQSSRAELPAGPKPPGSCYP